MNESVLSSRAFDRIQSMFQSRSGISLSRDKEMLIISRLRTRVEALGLPGFDAYVDHVYRAESEAERQCLVDLLTTNETYFFREPAHFDVLRKWVAQNPKRQYVAAWSAACSTGEEAYSIAMTLADCCGTCPWQVIGSDLSTRVLDVAAAGIYPMQRLDQMPADFLKKYCLRGKDGFSGQLRVAPDIRNKVRFQQHNLLQDGDSLGRFQIIFLRNVLIYFDTARKLEILGRVTQRLVPGGLLFLSHSESIHDHALPIEAVGRSVFRRTGQ